MGARVMVAGASGYAGGELLRLLAGHPDLELGAVTADGNAGRPVTDVHPQLTGVPPLAGRVFDPVAAGLRARLRPGLPGPARRAVGPPRRADPGPGPDRRPGSGLPAGRPGRLGQALPGRASGPLGLRPAGAAGRPGGNPGGLAGSGARLLRDGGDSRARAAAGRGAGRARRHRDRGRVRHLGRRARAPARPARQRGAWRCVGLPGGRCAPAHPGDRAGAGGGHPAGPRERRAGRAVDGVSSPRCSRRCRAASWRPAPPGCGRAATVPRPGRRDGRPAGYRAAAGGAGRCLCRRAVRAPDAAGAVAGHCGGGRVQRRAPAGRRRPAVRAGHRGGGDRQSRQGRGGPGGPERQPDARAAGDGRACPPAGSRHERDRAARLPGGGPGRRHQGVRPPRPRRGAERRPGRGRGRRVHRQPGLRRPGDLDPPGRQRRPGPGGGTQLRLCQRLHRPARPGRHHGHRAAAGRGGFRARRAGRGLLDRPDRRAAADGQAAAGRGRRGHGRHRGRRCRRGRRRS